MLNDDAEESLNSPHIVNGGGYQRPSQTNDGDEPTVDEPPPRRRRRSRRIVNSFNPTIQQVNSINNKGIEHITANGGSRNVIHRHRHQDLNSLHIERQPRIQDPIQSDPDASNPDPIAIDPPSPQANLDNAGDGSDNDNASNSNIGPSSFYSYNDGVRKTTNPTKQHVLGKGNSGIIDIDANGGQNNEVNDENDESLNSPHIINGPQNSQGKRLPSQGASGGNKDEVNRDSNNPTDQDVDVTGNSGIAHIAASGGSGNRVRLHRHQDLNSLHIEIPRPVPEYPPVDDTAAPQDQPSTDTV